MAESSFDIVSEFDAQELTNAIEGARREVQTRFDFKDTATTIERSDKNLVVESQTEDRARAAVQVLIEKGARRGLSAKLFQPEEAKTVGRGRGQVTVRLNAGISDELAKSLSKRVREVAPKAQVRIQGEQLRVTAKDKDTLQAVIKDLREDDSIPVPLQFTNYR